MTFSPTLSSTSSTPTLPTGLWDVFCRVIDNHGDLGVCWRLCADLAQHGKRVRLWVDDASALRWMAPQGAHNVDVFDWQDSLHMPQLGEVVIEAFGCELPESVQTRIAQHPPVVWINLEYLSAESYVPRAHGLPSPVMHGPAKGHTKWFFYPGFTPDTGGLLRETHLLQQQRTWDAQAWHKRMALPADPQALWVSMFCYEPAGMVDWLQSLALQPRSVHLLVTAGRAQAAMTQALRTLGWQAQLPQGLHIHTLPYLSQVEFDHLLWRCDLNFVRGEDSLVRALWAHRPCIWHIYPQDDHAHHAKLDAYLDWLQAPQSLRSFHHAWNGIAPAQTWDMPLQEWASCFASARARLLEQDSLSDQLLAFCASK